MQLNIRELNKFIFGNKQEKFIDAKADNAVQLTMFEEEKLGEIIVVSEEVVLEHTKKKKELRLNHKGRNPLPNDLRVEEVIIKPSGDLSGLIKIGEVVTDSMEYQQGEIYIKRFVRYEYIKTSEDGLNTKRVIADLPSFPLTKSYASSSVLAYLLVSKFVDHLPIYRQIEIFKRYNITFAKSTVSNWFKEIGHLLEPLYDAFKKEVLNTNYLNVDETTLKVLDKNKKGKTHAGFYWVYYNTITNMVLFSYAQGRGGEHPREMLDGFQGFLQADGYSGYEQFEQIKGIVVSNCWAHARRKFIDAQDYDKARTAIILLEIQKLYEIERECKTKNFDATQTCAYRNKHAKSVLDALLIILEEQKLKCLPTSPLGKAISYTLNRWGKLNVYLQDGNLTIDNNLIENSIRPIAIGRKNWMFAGNHDAAQRSAMFYSFFATCKLLNINPFEWMQYVLENIKEHKIKDINQLLPQNYRKITKQ